MTENFLQLADRVRQSAAAGDARETARPYAVPQDLPVAGTPASVSCFLPTGGICLVVIDLAEIGPEQPSPSSGVPLHDGRTHPAPLVRVMLPLAGGGRRQMIVFRPVRDAGVVTLSGPSGAVVGRVNAGNPLPCDISALAAGLDATGEMRLLRQLLEVCRDLFGLAGDAGYGRFCRRVVEALVSRPLPLRSEACVGDELALYSLSVPAGLGTVCGIFTVGNGPVQTGKYNLLPAGEGRAFLLAERNVSGTSNLMVIVGSAAAAVLIVAPPPERPLLRWLQAKRALASPIRNYVTRCLAGSGLARGPAATALLRELDFFRPAKQRGLADPKLPIGGAVELMVGDGEGGLFVKGWVRDPQNLCVAAKLAGPGIGKQRLDPDWTRYPRPDIDRHYGGRPGALGFVACLPDAGHPCGQASLELLLGSGASFDILARTASGNAVNLRDAVLGSIPPEYLTTDAIARVIAPAASRLHRVHLASRRTPDIVTFGEPVKRPRYSLVIPLYRNLDYLRFQVGSFATDPQLVEAEVIFVLDSPEQRTDLVHFLSGLHQLYRLPMTLLVMSGNFGYAAANNAAIAVARGRYLVLLNSDVVPERAGWLKALAAPLERSRRVVASGARLLFDDHSLQHAGMRFARDAGGHWLNLHYYKGAPRDYPPALVPRPVPAVTGAALLVRSKAFRDVGGFTEDYIIGDYEDSDLCLKLRSRGGEIEYAPAAVMFHFERKSINRHAGYQRSVAGLYNRWLAGCRWHGEMAALMSRFSDGAVA